LFNFVPGILLAWALLFGTKLDKWTKLLIGLVLSWVVVPLLGVLEFSFLGIGYTPTVFAINWILVAGVSAFFLFKQGQLFATPSRVSRKIRKYVSNESQEPEARDVNAWVSKHKVGIIFAFLLVLGIYGRIATSWSTSFFEFDPYYYHGLTEKVINTGGLPNISDDVYFTIDGSHQYTMRFPPLLHWMEAGNWFIYHAITGGAYDKFSLMLLDELYPPIADALMAGLGFVLVALVYGRYAGLVTAAFLVLLPQLMHKFAAGVAEQQPFGLMLAVALFAAFAIAVKMRSKRAFAVTALIAVASPLASQQYVWPFGVLVIYVGLQSLWSYWRKELDEQLVLPLAGTVFAQFVGTFLFEYYRVFRYGFPDNLAMLAAAVGVWCVALWYAPKLKFFENKARWMPLAAVVGVLFIASLLPILSGGRNPLGAGINYVQDVLSYTGYSPLEHTIQESGGTTAAYFEASFGVLNPYVVLFAVALFGAIGIISTFLGREKNELLLLYMILVIPVTYVGFSKVKFLVHMGIGLAIGAGFALGEFSRLLEEWSEKIGLDRAKARRTALIILLVIAVPALLVEAFYFTGSPVAVSCDPGVNSLTKFIALPFKTIPSAINGLCGARLSSDWVETTAWMRSNTPQGSRFVSWWDYGHWITFLDERKSVLSPSNVWNDLDQFVANAFVDNVTSLYDVMRLHNVQYVLVDNQLIPKYGALVYLSGTCDKQLHPLCPDEKRIPNWQSGAGGSAYELTHQFEYLYLLDQACPGVPGAQLPAVQSTASNYAGKPVVYCAADSNFLLLTDKGVNNTYSRKFQITQTPAEMNNANVSYLLPYQQNVFLNINPDYSFMGLKSKLFESAFVRLYLRESLPGFELVFTSKNGEVKIFKYTGQPTASTPASSSTIALPTPSPTATPSPASNATNSTS
jgi:asparagine N-glycosylation enzyme membrane subunit Stt3